ncbi:hypothetical protein [Mycoplasma sp. E35C]|uniref:hypothetical protein n=1 Tax=Mycoplasma sp. E35C TaxID=2801918 RepID=UPI0021039400|nr:hypothetical protein [Mycoplasma sp. E35C]
MALKKTIILSTLGVVTGAVAVGLPIALTSANINPVIDPLQAKNNTQEEHKDMVNPSGVIDHENNPATNGVTNPQSTPSVNGPINNNGQVNPNGPTTSTPGVVVNPELNNGMDGMSPGVAIPGTIITQSEQGNLSPNLNAGAVAGGVIGGISAVGAIGAGVGLLLNTFNSNKVSTTPSTQPVKKSVVLRDFNLTKSNIGDLASASLEKFDLIEIKDKNGNRGAFWAPQSWFDKDRRNTGIVGGDYVANPEFRSFLRYINENPSEMGNPNSILNYLAKQNSGDLDLDQNKDTSAKITAPNAFRQNSSNSDEWESYDLDKLFNEKADSTVSKPSNSEKEQAKKFLQKPSVSTVSSKSNDDKVSILSGSGVSRQYSIKDIEEELTRPQPSRGQTSNLSLLTVLAEGTMGKRVEKRIVPRDSQGRPLISEPVNVVAQKLLREDSKKVFEEGFYLAQVTYTDHNNQRKVSPVFLPVSALNDENKYETAASLKSLFSNKNNSSTDPSVYAAALITENIYETVRPVSPVQKVDLYGSFNDYQSVYDDAKNSIILVTDDKSKEKTPTDYSIYAKIDKTRKPALASEATINEVNEQRRRQQALRELAEVPPPLPERNLDDLVSNKSKTPGSELSYSVNLNSKQASSFRTSVLDQLSNFGSSFKKLFSKKSGDDVKQTFPWYRSHLEMWSQSELDKIYESTKLSSQKSIKNRLSSWSSSIKTRFNSFFKFKA